MTRTNTPRPGSGTPRPEAHPRIARFSGSSNQHAARIAEAVDETWHTAHGHDDLDVPVSVVAALALIAPPPEQRDHAAAEVIALDDTGFAALIRHVWADYIRARPDLINRAWPLVRTWHGENTVQNSTTLRAARRVADTALRHGLWHLTAEPESRWQSDLLGHLLTTLRGGKATHAHSAFYTPADVATLMAGQLEPPQEGQSVHEPAAGTGGMLRATAQLMREHGRDPATVTWVAVDTDALAIACLAINVVLWRLGPRVLLGLGNALTDDWLTRAHAERRETIQIAQQIRRGRQMRDVLNHLTRSTEPDPEHRDSAGESPDAATDGDGP